MDLYFPPFPLTAWTAYTPNVSAAAGTITTVGARSGRFLKVGKTVFFSVDVTITTNGTGSAALFIDLPPFVAQGVNNAVGREGAVTGKTVTGQTLAASGVLTVQFYDNTYPGADGAHVQMTGVYEAQ